MRKTVHKILLLFLYLCLSTNISHAQNSEKEICTHLLSLFEKISSLDCTDSAQGAQLIKENRQLKNYIDKMWAHNPSTLHMGFSCVDNYLHITTSDDGKVRAYYWGSNIYNAENCFIQCQDGKDTKITWDYKIHGNIGDMKEDEFAEDLSYSNILSVPTKDNRTVYLAIFYSYIPHTHSQSDGIEAYVIDHGKLEPTSIFKTAKKTLNSIFYRYDGQAPPPNADSRIHFSRDKQKLYIPIVRENDSKTDNYLVYVFDGNNYVFDKNAH